MKRTVLTLVVTVFGLALTTAALADDPVQPGFAPNAAKLNLPPVLPPNDGAAAAPLVINPTGGGNPATSGGAPVTKQLVIDPTQPNQLAYYSPRLGARFLIQQMYLPQFGSFWAARIVSQPEFNSPLRQLGLDEGDVITRLDGLPVINTMELERHILQTGVRFIHAGEQVVHKGTMFINPGQYFVDPYNPVCNHPVAINP
jgi:hypothetical protein